MINAPPAAIHRYAGDLQYWPIWAQWDRTLSPANELSQPSTGVGAWLTWHGHGRKSSDETEGEVRIVESDPNRGVRFEHRMPGGKASRAALLYAVKPGVTEVTWRDEGQLPPIVGGLFLDFFQTRLARHMAEGLTRLKAVVEQSKSDVPPAPAP